MKGYNRLASLWTVHPDLAFFRQFRTLAFRDLLYYQGQLAVAEGDLTRRLGGDVIDTTQCDFEWDVAKLLASDPEQGQHLDLTLKIRDLLTKYYDALTRFHKVLNLPRAPKHDVKLLRDWVYDENGLDCKLKGQESDIWEERFEFDLVTLTDRLGDKDIVFKLVDKHVLPLYNRLIGRKRNKPAPMPPMWCDEGLTTEIHHYRDDRLAKVIDMLSTILASLLPAVSIFAPYFISDEIIRMVVIIAMTFVFATVLTLISDARRIEVFAATAAYAAVQVVFISGTTASMR